MLLPLPWFWLGVDAAFDSVIGTMGDMRLCGVCGWIMFCGVEKLGAYVCMLLPEDEPMPIAGIPML